MKRSTQLLMAAGVAALLAALAGSLAAIGGGQDDDARAVTGERNALRLEPAKSEVSCGGGTVAVNLYLDDLVARPSPLDASVPHGIAGFQVILRYNPAVLRLSLAGVELGPGLDSFDADGDGITRRFFVVQDVDDYLGRAVVGAGSVVTGEVAPDRPREEGPDPTAYGRPVLLMTIRFQTMGHGDGGLALADLDEELPGTLSSPAIVDPDRQLYEPLELEAHALTVSGGDCPAAPEITPRPTPGPTATYPVEPTVTPVEWSTVVAPEAPQAGRDDCPADWRAYEDGERRFSICYPADFGASASSFALNATSPSATQGSDASLTIVVSWGERPYFSFEPTPQNCALVADSLLGPTDSGTITLTLSGRKVEACLNEGRVNSIHGGTALAEDGSDGEGFIRFTVNYSGSSQDASGQALRILESLRVDFR